MNRIIIFLLWIIFFPLISIGQKFDVNNYKPIKSSGEIPLDFRKTSEQKYLEDKAEISKEEQRFTRKSKYKFLLQSNFLLDNLLLSGEVLFNDPLTKYVNRVVDELLKGEENEALRDEIRIYVTKSPYVNAFSTDQGIILINIGLLAQLENEAQLAYVISHELIHYLKEHSINLFVETEKLSHGRGGYSRLSNSSLFLEKNLRSREIESEADELGFKMFYSKSNYSLDELDGVFDVLQYSYLPFDEIVFDTNFFNTKYFKLSKEYFLDEVAAIRGGEDYDESKSTHPSIDKRRANIELLKNEIDNSGKKKFILPKEDFKNARLQARFEVIRQQLIARNYPVVIYNSYVLLKKYPNNKFLKTAIASSLYGLTEYKIHGGFSQVCKSYKKIEGESQQVFHLFKKIDEKNLNVLALEYCWNLHKKYPDNRYLYSISDSLFKELVFENKLISKKFYKKSKGEINSDIVKKDEKVDSVNLSKYDRIKRKRKTQNIKDDNSYLFAFVDLFKDKEFEERFIYWDEQYVKEKNETDIFQMNAKERKAYYRKENSYKRQIEEYGYALGVDTMVIVDPVYYKIDERKETQIRFIDSERKQTEFNNMIKKNSKLVGVNLQLIDSKNLNSEDTETFNELALLNDWISECFNHEDLELLMSESQYVHEIVKKYNTKHFAWSALFNVRQNNIEWSQIALYFMGVYTIPIAIYYIVKPDYYTCYFNFLFDIESGKLEFSTTEEVGQNDDKGFLNSRIYDTFFQINARRK